MDDKELQTLVEEVSLRSFGKPFRHQVYFNGRLKSTGGRYLLNTHNIEINRKYLDQLGLTELLGIIKHELCHYHLHLEGKGYQHRDRDFKLLMEAVGAPRFCSPLPERTRKLPTKIVIYACVQCGQTFERKRRMNIEKYVCGKCKGRLSEVKEGKVK